MVYIIMQQTGLNLIFMQEHKIHLFLGNNLPPGKSQPVCLRVETVLGSMLFLININELIIDCDFYTPSPTMFSDIKWMSFHERVIYMKAIQMFKTIRGFRLNTLDRLLLLRLIYMQDCCVRSSSNFQLYTPKPQKYIEMHEYFRFIRFELPSYIHN